MRQIAPGQWRYTCVGCGAIIDRPNLPFYHKYWGIWMYPCGGDPRWHDPDVDLE
jgi:hypothetical protein